MEKEKTLSAELDKLREEAYAEQAEHEAEHHHHHHDDDDDDDHDHCCHHHHDDDEDEDEHEHHHHHDEDEDEHEHHHHHHHHHHADEVFDQFGVETAKRYTKEEMQGILEQLENEEECGMVLRSKGIVEGEDGEWIHFDYVPGEPEVRNGTAEATGMICVIGTGLKQDHIKELFGIAK